MKQNRVEELKNYLTVRGLYMSDMAIANAIIKIQCEGGLKKFKEAVEAWRPFVAFSHNPANIVMMHEVLDYILIWATELDAAKREC